MALLLRLIFLLIRLLPSCSPSFCSGIFSTDSSARGADSIIMALLRREAARGLFLPDLPGGRKTPTRCSAALLPPPMRRLKSVIGRCSAAITPTSS